MYHGQFVFRRVINGRSRYLVTVSTRKHLSNFRQRSGLSGRGSLSFCLPSSVAFLSVCFLERSRNRLLLLTRSSNHFTPEIELKISINPFWQIFSRTLLITCFQKKFSSNLSQIFEPFVYSCRGLIFRSLVTSKDAEHGESKIFEKVEIKIRRKFLEKFNNLPTNFYKTTSV